MRNLTEVSSELTAWMTSDIPRIPTGYPMFDKRIGGIATGELAAMMARSGVGKTWFGINVVARNANIPTLFFSLEMHDRYLLKRLAGVFTGIPTYKIEEELANNAGKSAAIQATVDRFDKLVIEDGTGLSIADMVLGVEEYQDTMGVAPSLVVIDHTKLVSSFGMSEVESVTGLMRSFKRFARETNTAVLVLHQASRGTPSKASRDSEAVKNEGHKPLRMTDMEYGGEQDVDYLFGMYRPELEPGLTESVLASRRGDMRFQFLKTRADNGIHPQGVQHYFDEPSGRIAPLVVDGRW